MFDKLEHIVQRINEIQMLMSDPAVAADRQKSRDLGKELRTLEPILKTYEAYKKAVRNTEGSKEILETAGDAEMKALAQEEYELSKLEAARLEEELKALLVPKDPNDDKNFIMEIRAGTGGEEAALFAADLYRMYNRYAER